MAKTNFILSLMSTLVFFISCKTPNNLAKKIADVDNDEGDASLSSIDEAKNKDLVLTSWFRVSEVALLSKIKFPIDAPDATSFKLPPTKGKTNVSMDVRLVPTFVENPNYGQIKLNLLVSVVGQNKQSERGVTVQGGINSTALVTKNLKLNLEGITSEPASVQSNVDPMSPSILSTGLLKRLKTRIANRMYWEQIGAHVTAVESHLQNLPAQVDRAVDENLKVITKTWRETFYKDFLQNDTSGTSTRMFTSKTALNFAVFQSEANLGTKVKRIFSDDWDGSSAVLMVHGAQVDYQLNHLLKNKTISLGDLKKNFCKFDLGITLCATPGKNSTEQSEKMREQDDQRRIRFHEQKAVHVMFYESDSKERPFPVLELEFFAAFSPNLDQFLHSKISYEIDLDKKQARRKELSVKSLSKETIASWAGKEKKEESNATNKDSKEEKKVNGSWMGAWDAVSSSVGEAFAKIAESVFRSSLPETLRLSSIPIPLVGELVPKKWSIQDSWLRATWDFIPWQDIYCDKVSQTSFYDGMVCNKPFNGKDACWEHKGKDFYGNINGWIKCGESWKGTLCSDLSKETVYYGKKCRHVYQGKDECWYQTGNDEPGNINGWKKCPEVEF